MCKRIWIIFWYPIPVSWIFPNELKLRCDIAIELYKSWYIEKILVTGWKSKFYKHNHSLIESECMIDYLISQWIWSQTIIKESLSQNTFENIINSIFIVKKLSYLNVVMISSSYHITRIRIICQLLHLHFNVLYSSVEIYCSMFKKIIQCVVIVYDLFVVCRYRIWKTSHIDSNIE